MADPFVAEIRMFSGNFAPRGWAFCNGQLMPINQNTALFSILGTNYGGDGKNTFGLPNLMGRAALGAGEGPGLTWRELGEMGGASSVTLTPAEMPEHTHTAQASAAAGDAANPDSKTFAANGKYAAAPNTSMNWSALQATGGDQPHNNMPPYLGLSFIIALQGVFPPRW